MKVSIITPSFNRADLVHETAESIFRQTYSNWEWVIIDDGSTDGSWELLEEYKSKDDRIKLYKRERLPKGAASCRNIAVEKCTGEYLIFLDTDDIMATFCLQQRVDAVKRNPDADFVVFPMLLFKKVPDDTKILWNIDKPVDDIDRILMGDGPWPGTGTFWKRNSFTAIGMWDETLLMWQDVELHLRSLLYPLHYKKCFDLEPDVFIRVSDSSISRTGYHSLPKLLSRKKVIQLTLQLMQQKNKLERYKSGMRSILIDLFVNVANQRLSNETEALLDMALAFNLFSQKEIVHLKKYAWLRKGKLYKLPFLQKYFYGTLAGKKVATGTTLNTVSYATEIRL
jgi:glycosyltransferase involved in cell wall biosynthesis